MIMLIAYDKKTTFKNYEQLFNAIKAADAWWHHLDHVWIIRTNYDAKYWYSNLASYITQLDRILIIEVTPQYQGWLNKEAWDWLQLQFRREGYNI